MNRGGTLAAIAGTILLLGSALLLTRRRVGPAGLPALVSNDASEPVVELADELKEAWSDHHTQA